MMSQVRIQSGIFDIGKVLLHFDFELSFTKWKPSCKTDLKTTIPILWKSGLLEAYEHGRITTQEFASGTMEIIKFQGSPKELIDGWSDIFTPNEEMIRRAKRWKAKGIHIYLLSNTCEAHMDFFTRKFDFLEMFDGRIYSHLEGCAKPQPIIYKKIVERYGLNPSSTLFIDDRIENVLGAHSAKINSIHYSNEEKLIESLKTFNLD
jgi:glucose-1-phosphatase